MDTTPDASARSDARTGVRVAWHALWTSRLVVMAAGILAVLEIGRAPGTAGFDPGNLTAPFGYFGNLLVAPLARWDSWWYLSIAMHGYEHVVMRTAFFPLYPLAVRCLGVIVRSDLIAAVILSLVSFGVALVLLYRLALLELRSASRARLAVMLVAFCPVAFFFSAVYSESMFLALSLGAVFQARMGRWATAGLLGALGAAERNSGVVLVVPLALLFLYGPRADRPPGSDTERRPGPGWRRLLPRYRIEPQIIWIAVVPVGLLAYFAYLGLSLGNALAPLHAQALWFHHFAGPFGGVYDGAVAAWDGLRQLIHGSRTPVYFTAAGGDPFVVAGENLMLFGFLALGAVACVGALRRLPIAYGAYVVAALALPLSDPVGPQPLASLARYEVVLFPLFMWAAAWLDERGWGDSWLAGSAVLLGLFTAMFATWRFVS